MQKSGIWRFSGVLRVFALVMAALHVLAALTVLPLVFIIERKEVFDYFGLDGVAPLDPWQVILGFAVMFILFTSSVVIFLAVAQFLKASKNDGFFVDGVITACRKLGYGLLLYWLGLILFENIMPGVMSLNFPEDERVPIDWIPVDHFGIFLVGIILFLMAQAMEEAREIDSDNKQII